MSLLLKPRLSFYPPRRITQALRLIFRKACLTLLKACLILRKARRMVHASDWFIYGICNAVSNSQAQHGRGLSAGWRL